MSSSNSNDRTLSGVADHPHWPPSNVLDKQLAEQVQAQEEANEADATTAELSQQQSQEQPSKRGYKSSLPSMTKQSKDVQKMASHEIDENEAAKLRAIEADLRSRLTESEMSPARDEAILILAKLRLQASRKLSFSGSGRDMTYRDLYCAGLHLRNYNTYVDCVSAFKVSNAGSVSQAIAFLENLLLMGSQPCRLSVHEFYENIMIQMQNPPWEWPPNTKSAVRHLNQIRWGAEIFMVGFLCLAMIAALNNRFHGEIVVKACKQLASSFSDYMDETSHILPPRLREAALCIWNIYRDESLTHQQICSDLDRAKEVVLHYYSVEWEEAGGATDVVTLPKLRSQVGQVLDLKTTISDAINANDSESDDWWRIGLRYCKVLALVCEGMVEASEQLREQFRSEPCYQNLLGANKLIHKLLCKYARVKKREAESNGTVFLCHSGRDKSYVDVLNTLLKTATMATFFDEANLQVGETLSPSLSRALLSCSVGIAVLSSRSVSGPYILLEFGIMEARAAIEPSFKLVPDTIERGFVDVLKRLPLPWGEHGLRNTLHYREPRELAHAEFVVGSVIQLMPQHSNEMNININDNDNDDDDDDDDDNDDNDKMAASGSQSNSTTVSPTALIVSSSKATTPAQALATVIDDRLQCGDVDSARQLGEIGLKCYPAAREVKKALARSYRALADQLEAK